MGNSISVRIYELIQALNIKKVRFAERLGVDQSYITKLTAGRGNPSDRLISSICREFNVNENWLRNGEGEMFNTTPETLIDKLAKEYQLDELGRDIMMGYLQLSENERIAVNQLMQNIIDKRSSRRVSMPPPKPPTLQPEPTAEITSKSPVPTDDTAARLKRLEQENREMRAELEALKQEELSETSYTPDRQRGFRSF